MASSIQNNFQSQHFIKQNIPLKDLIAGNGCDRNLAKEHWNDIIIKGTININCIMVERNSVSVSMQGINVISTSGLEGLCLSLEEGNIAKLVLKDITKKQISENPVIWKEICQLLDKYPAYKLIVDDIEQTSRQLFEDLKNNAIPSAVSSSTKQEKAATAKKNELKEKSMTEIANKLIEKHKKDECKCFSRLVSSVNGRHPAESKVEAGRLNPGLSKMIEAVRAAIVVDIKEKTVKPDFGNPNSIPAIAQAIKNKNFPQLGEMEETDLLLRLKNDGHLFESDEVAQIREYLRMKWLDEYIQKHGELDKTLIELVEEGFYKQFFSLSKFRNTVCYSFPYKTRTQFNEALDAFFQVYQKIDCRDLRSAFLILAISHPTLFFANDRNENISFLISLLEKRDNLVSECLLSMAKMCREEWLPWTPPTTKHQVLKTWIYMQRNMSDRFFNSSLSDLKVLLERGLPKAWIVRTVQELMYFTDVDINCQNPDEYDRMLNKLFGKRNFFDFYFRLRTNSSFLDHHWKEIFPKDVQANFAGLYALPKNVNPEKQNDHGYMMHQTVLIAADLLRTNDWNLDQLLALLMSIRNFMANVLSENCAEEMALPGPRPGMSLCTPCPPTLAYSIPQILNNNENIMQDEQFPFIYHLKAPLFDQIFTYAMIKFTEENGAMIIHPNSPEVRKEMMKGISKLFNEVKMETSQAICSKKLALIFWWIVRSKYWLDGEVEIAEAVIRSLAKAKGFDFQPWKPGLSIQEEVLKCLNPNEFSEKFHTFFIS